MSILALIAHFQDEADFPISVDDVRDWILRNGLQDSVTFYPTKMDSNILKGEFCQYTKRPGVYAPPELVTEITYPESLNACWERFVCCKEMMHIFDSAEERTATAEQIEQLTFDLASPVDGHESPATDAERNAQIMALMILAPIKAIEKLRAVYVSGAKSEYDIALFFRIPQIYVSFIMSELYSKHANTVLEEANKAAA